MAFFIYLCLFLTVIDAKDDPSETCGPNSHYVKCAKSCITTCENTPTKCEPCFTRCLCVKGYVLDKYGRCVSPEKCPGVCGPNEIWIKTNHQCATTCENYYSDFKQCPPPEDEECRCKPGFVLYNEICVPPHECPVLGGPHACGKNAVFMKYASMCPRTCDNYKNHVQKRCGFKRGCECIPGFILYGKRCIKSHQCPKRKCGPNEEFVECVSPCPLTCENYNKPPTNCPQDCERGCQCKSHYVWNGIECVLPKQCTVKKHPCGENEAWNPKMSSCRLTCDHPERSALCRNRTTGGCDCITGYLFHQGKCIHPELCPNSTSH